MTLIPSTLILYLIFVTKIALPFKDKQNTKHFKEAPQFIQKWAPIFLCSGYGNIRLDKHWVGCHDGSAPIITNHTSQMNLLSRDERETLSIFFAINLEALRQVQEFILRAL